MVNPSSYFPDAPSYPYTIKEQFLFSKTGKPEDGEDAIYTSPHFAAVIDGATSKTSRRWHEQKGGKIAAATLKQTFAHIPASSTARQAVDSFTAAIHDLYVEFNVSDVVAADPVQRITASFVAISLQRRELWFVGDCQCLLDHTLITNAKAVDTITADARSLFLESEISQGKTIAQLQERDTGRDFILPLLERQALFQNTPSSGQYWFPVIDGFPVPDSGIRTQPLPTDTSSIILASDGYPFLHDSLTASEQALQDLLHDDPLLFRLYKSTKGLQSGNLSYDDRAYLHIQLHLSQEGKKP